jgi:acetylglutamate kinase
MTVQKSQAKDAPPELIDLGRVGEVTQVNPHILQTIEVQDFIPVIAPVGVGEDNFSYNINADLVAGAVAGRLKAAKLILLTDVEGVLNKGGTLLPSLSSSETDKLLASGAIAGGMIPKVKCCLSALEAGVTKTHIIDGRVEHAILLEMFTREGVGTEIVL